MDQEIEILNSYLEELGQIPLILKKGKKLVPDYDLEEIGLENYNASKKIKAAIRKLLLLSQSQPLAKFKSEVESSCLKLKQLNSGILSTGDFSFRIEPETLKEVITIKLRYAQEIIEYINKYSIVKESMQDKNHFEDKNWFKVGILFANGTIYDKLNEHNKNNERVAKNLFGSNFKSFRPYISASAANTVTSDKNIFTSKEKTDAILNYCKRNGIRVDSRFLQSIKFK